MIRLAAILRMTPAEALAHIDPFDPRLEGELYVRQTPDRPVTDEEVSAWLQRIGSWSSKSSAESWLTRRRLFDERKVAVVGGLELDSQAATPFELDGVTYPSLRRFYDALKIPAGELRTRFLAGASARELGIGRGHANATFEFDKRTIAVGSLEHSQLVARAVSAKVAAHAEVRRELARTGRTRLVMGDPNSQPLGRVTPFALMIERLRG